MLRLLLLSYLTLAAYAYFFSDRQIFLPPPATYQDTPEIIKLTTVGGEKISAIHQPVPQADLTILYSHGNAEDLGDFRPIAETLGNLGFSVFAYDYRGYGTSEGKASVQHTYEDIDAAYRYLTQTLKVPPAQIVVYGRSVGGGPSTYLASRQPVGGLVLESTFITAFRVVIPVPLLPFDPFPNLARLSRVNCPILIMHGTQDEVIPFWHGEELFKRAKAPKQFVPISGAGHNDLIWVAGDRYPRALQAFGDQVRQLNQQKNQHRKKSD